MNTCRSLWSRCFYVRLQGQGCQRCRCIAAGCVHAMQSVRPVVARASQVLKLNINRSKLIYYARKYIQMHNICINYSLSQSKCFAVDDVLHYCAVHLHSPYIDYRLYLYSLFNILPQTVQLNSWTFSEAERVGKLPYEVYMKPSHIIKCNTNGVYLITLYQRIIGRT